MTFPIKKILLLPVPADLSLSSFELAEQMLREVGDQPRFICSTVVEVDQALVRWLHRKRSVSYFTMPKEILKHDDCWFLEGINHIVVSV